MPGTISVQTGHFGTALTALSPQPHFEGMRYPKRTYAADGTPYDDGDAFGVLRFPPMTEGQLGTVYAAFGIGGGTVSGEATVSLPGEDRNTMTSYNTVAEQVPPRWDNPLYYDVQIIVRQLETF